MVLPRPRWCYKPLLWRDTGQVSDSRPGEQTVHPIQKGKFLPPPRCRPNLCLSHSAHIHTQTLSHVYTYMCAQRGHLLPAVRLQAVPCIQTPLETTSHQHPYTLTQSQRTKNNVQTHVHLHTLSHARIATTTCVRNTTTLNQHIYTHAFTHMCLFTDSLERRAGSDLGT